MIGNIIILAQLCFAAYAA